MTPFQTVVPYILQGLLGLIAVLALVKDWKDYGEASGKYKSPVRILVLVLTVAVTVLSLIDTYNSRSEAARKEAESSKQIADGRKQIDDLTEQVRLGREENKRSAEQTLDELKASGKSIPKARLVAGFWQPDIHTDLFPIKTTVQRRSDGSVAFDIITLNKSDVTALKAAFVVRICTLCKFAKEPQGSVHTDGQPEQEREFDFLHIFAHSNLPKSTIEVIPPSGAGFTVLVFYRCENCVPVEQTLSVYVQ
jgi:hypothetical protein